MKRIKRFIATFLAVILSLTFSASCSFSFFWENQVKIPSDYDLAYSLTQTDVDQLKSYYQTAKSIILENGNQTEMIKSLNQFIISINWLINQVYYALILYNYDYKSEEAKERYLFANAAYQDAYSYYVDILKTAYNSTFKDLIFDGWSEKEINGILKSDEEVTAINKQNEELVVTYAGFSKEELMEKTHEIYRQIVVNNNTKAKKFGYDNYYDYATEMENNRECSSEELQNLRYYVAEKIVPVLKSAISILDEIKVDISESTKNKVDDIFSLKYDECEVNYFKEYIKSFNGSSTAKAFDHAITKNNLLFGEQGKSKEGAFNIYISSPSTPYCYFGPGYQDLFTVAHETGHYYAAYAKNGHSDIDIAEIHSQSNELLLLKFMESQLTSDEFKYLEAKQIVSTLKTIVASTIIDEFEYQVYSSSNVENYTAQEFDSIMSDIIANYGGADFVNGKITNINYYWRLVTVENPVYYISYAISAISALGLYVQACDNETVARENYKKLVENCANQTFTKALTNSNYYNPFYLYAYTEIEKLIPILQNEKVITIS